jgi:hypothetical protein
MITDSQRQASILLDTLTMFIAKIQLCSVQIDPVDYKWLEQQIADMAKYNSDEVHLFDLLQQVLTFLESEYYD